METTLYNSNICRLCGERSQNGIRLYVSDERDISQLINSYLPLKIWNDGQHPQWICPGCHLQVESAVEFFDLVLKGQENLRGILNEQSQVNVEQSKKINLFSEDHVIHSRFGSVQKEKRKRGRPTKTILEKLKKQEQQASEAAKIEQSKNVYIEPQELPDENSAGRRKRKIKLPSRFQEVVQGRELERIYVENGVIDKFDNLSDNECITNEADVNDYSEGVIGHMEDTNGLNVVDLVFDSTKIGKKYSHSSQKKKFICEICSRTYTQQLRCMSHKMSHHNVQYECIQCLEKFSSRQLISEHQEATQHTGEGIIESLDTETNADVHVLNGTVTDGVADLIGNNVKEDSQDVFDEMDNIEEAAKVLYGLQNMDRIESPQCLSVSVGQSAREAKSEFLTYTNYKTDKNFTQEFKMEQQPNKEKAIQKLDNTQGTTTGNSPVKKRHDCSICNKTFANESLLSVHFPLIHEIIAPVKSVANDNSKDTSMYPCDKCKRLFKNPSSLLYHKNSEHNHFRFVCKRCGKSFKHKQLLRRHQLVHSQDRPYSCTTCGALFKTKPNLLNHLPIHNPVKNHNCNICKQSFAHKTTLKLHILWHSGAKPFSCQVCGKSFSQNGNLQEHIRIHTNVRPYSCQHCDKKFKTSSQCQIHSKRHNIHLKPFSCHICSKSFLQHDILKTHLRRHNNEKPFSCSYCEKSFSEHWAMIKHCRIHTKEKTHQNANVLPQSNELDQSSTSDNFVTTTVQDQDKEYEKSITGKCDDIPADNLFDSIVLADISTNEISDSTVWRLADQTDIDKDNQIFYVTYQDPNLGKTVKLVNQVTTFPHNRLDTNSGLGFPQEPTNDKLSELHIAYGDVDADDPTSNIQLMADSSENEKSVVVNDSGDLFDMNAAGLEIITTDGRKLRFLQTI